MRSTASLASSVQLFFFTGHCEEAKEKLIGLHVRTAPWGHDGRGFAPGVSHLSAMFKMAMFRLSDNDRFVTNYHNG